jgi:glutathione peroxidase-family protein
MKISTIIIFCSLLMMIQPAKAQNCYDLTVQARDGKTMPLSAYKGQKILIGILPGAQSQDDKSILKRIDSIANTLNGKIVMIAIPSYEVSGGTDSIDVLLKWYKSVFTSNIIQSIPVYTNKSSGAQQDNLFNWLTHASKNTHFDYEITGGGTLFLINENGELTSILGPEAKFSNKALRMMLR